MYYVPVLNTIAEIYANNLIYNDTITCKDMTRQEFLVALNFFFVSTIQGKLDSVSHSDRCQNTTFMYYRSNEQLSFHTQPDLLFAANVVRVTALTTSYNLHI